MPIFQEMRKSSLDEGTYPIKVYDIPASENIVPATSEKQVRFIFVLEYRTLFCSNF